MTFSGLTESGLSGRIISPKLIDPGFAGRAARPFRRAVSFLGFDSPQPKLCIRLRRAGVVKLICATATTPAVSVARLGEHVQPQAGHLSARPRPRAAHV